MQLGKQVLRFKWGFTKQPLFLKQPRKKALIRKVGLGQRCCSSGWVLVVKIDSDGATCQDVVCHATRFLLFLLLSRSRPARPPPAALGAARALVQRPADEDAAVQEHLLEGGKTAGQVNARRWEPESQCTAISDPASIRSLSTVTIPTQTGCSIFLCAQERGHFPSAWLRS